MKKVINTKNAPAAIGPYSQAIMSSDMLFISGQIPVNPLSGTIESNDIKGQTLQVFNNIKAILEEADYCMEDIIKTTVFLSDMSLFADMNEVYASMFTGNYPARAAFAVKELPKGSLVEIEAIAMK